MTNPKPETRATETDDFLRRSRAFMEEYERIHGESPALTPDEQDRLEAELRNYRRRGGNKPPDGARA